MEKLKRGYLRPEAMLPLIEMLVVGGSPKLRNHWASQLDDEAESHRVLGFTFAGGDATGFGENSAGTPEWRALDETGRLTEVLCHLQRAALCQFWAEFLRDPARMVWSFGC